MRDHGGAIADSFWDSVSVILEKRKKQRPPVRLSGQKKAPLGAFLLSDSLTAEWFPGQRAAPMSGGNLFPHWLKAFTVSRSKALALLRRLAVSWGNMKSKTCEPSGLFYSGIHLLILHPSITWFWAPAMFQPLCYTLGINKKRHLPVPHLPFYESTEEWLLEWIHSDKCCNRGVVFRSTDKGAHMSYLAHPNERGQMQKVF